VVRGLGIFQEWFAAYADQYVLIGGTATSSTAATCIPLDKKIGDDMARFLAAVGTDPTIDPKALQLGNVAVAELVARIAKAYEIEQGQS